MQQWWRLDSTAESWLDPSRVVALAPQSPSSGLWKVVATVDQGSTGVEATLLGDYTSKTDAEEVIRLLLVGQVPDSWL
jgi:hypothetical protein